MGSNNTTVLYHQNLTTIAFVFLFFAGPFSSFAQPDERLPLQSGDYQANNDMPVTNSLPSPPLSQILPELGPPSPLQKEFSSFLNETGKFRPSPPPSPKEPRNESTRKQSRNWNTTGGGELVSSSKGKLNEGKKVGLAFLAVAVVLQFVLATFLMYKRRTLVNF